MKYIHDILIYELITYNILVAIIRYKLEKETHKKLLLARHI
jgi:hypothetical protein